MNIMGSTTPLTIHRIMVAFGRYLLKKVVGCKELELLIRT